MLWSAYGFRYAARPGNALITPPTSVFLETLHRPMEAHAIGFAERHHLFPEAYLYGLTDIASITSEGRPTFLFGSSIPPASGSTFRPPFSSRAPSASFCC